MTPGWLVVAAVAGSSAAWLLVRPSPRPVGPRPRPGAVWVLLVAGLVLGLAAQQAVSARVAAVAVLAVGAASGARALVHRRTRRRDIEAGQARTLEFCQLVAAELAGGQPPGTALERAASEWPELGPVASTFRLGGDVPGALRAAAGQPGQGDLVLAAAAWQVTHQTGGGLTAAVSRVAAGLRATQATRRVVRAELASARATARLMAALPVLALLMGSGIGGDPVAFLVGSTEGLGCFGAGLALGFAGLWWIEAIADDVSAGEP